MFASRKTVAVAVAMAFALMIATPASRSATPDRTDIQVNVSRHDDVIAVHAQLSVPVPAKLAFAVLTDYDHMRRFLPNLTESRILKHSPNRLLVAQAGGVPLGPISIPFNYVRQVDLQADTRMVSHVVSGSVKKADVTTTLTESGGQTSITYDSEATTGIWLPFGIGTGIIAGQVRRQLDSMREEMLRRQAASQPLK